MLFSTLRGSLMKSLLATVCAACLIARSAIAQNQYQWTISSSLTDPCVNTGPVAAGVATMALWYSFNTRDGMSAADFGVVANAGNVILAFNPANGFLNAGTATALLLGVGGCPDSPVMAGTWLVLRNVPLDMCLTGANITVDCSPTPSAWPNGFIGFSETGAPCGENSCAGDSVEDTSWGMIKALYR